MLNNEKIGYCRRENNANLRRFVALYILTRGLDVWLRDVGFADPRLLYGESGEGTKAAKSPLKRRRLGAPRLKLFRDLCSAYGSMQYNGVFAIPKENRNGG